MKKFKQLVLRLIKAGLSVNKAFALAAILFIGAVSSYATDPGAPDPTATITSLTGIFDSVGAVAVTILLWNVGSRLVRRFFR